MKGGDVGHCSKNSVVLCATRRTWSSSAMHGKQGVMKHLERSLRQLLKSRDQSVSQDLTLMSHTQKRAIYSRCHEPQ